MHTSSLIYWFVVVCMVALLFSFFMAALFMAIKGFYLAGLEVKNRRRIKKFRKNKD